MSDDIQIRSYQDGDEEGIVQLLDQAFNGWPRIDLQCSPVDHWRWKYRDGPIKMDTTTVAVSENRVIGVNHAYAVPVIINGDRIYASFSGDMAVDMKYRGRGLSKKLIEQSTRIRAEHDISMIYFVTRNPFLIKSYERDYLGFPFNVALLARIVDLDTHLNKVPMKNKAFIKTAYLVAEAFNKASNVIRKDADKVSVDLKEISRFNVEHDHFWDNIKQDYDFILDRTSEYLNWRYLDPRAGDFRVVQASDADGLHGFCVTRINRYREDYPIGFIVDLLVKNRQPHILDQLITNALEHFTQHDVNLILVGSVRQQPDKNIYHRNGFLDPRINFRLFYGDYTHQIKAKNVHFTFGDIDSLPSEIEIN